MLLIGTDSGIYRWAEGNSWPVFHGLQDRAVVSIVSAGKGSVVALDGDKRLWESGDAGMTWRSLPLPEGAGSPVSIGAGGHPASILFTTTGAGGFSRLAGSRTSPPKPLLTTVVESATTLSDTFRLAAEKARSVRKSGGTALLAKPASKKPAAPVIGWNKLGKPAGGSTGAAFRLLFVGESVVFGTLDGVGLMTSSDRGATWTKAGGPGPEVTGIREIPGSGGGLVASTTDGVWFSPDAGKTWEQRSKGLETLKFVRVVDVNPSDHKSLIAAANTQASDAPQGDALVESSDGGKSWTRVLLRAFPENPRFDKIVDVRHDPAHADNIAVAFESGELWMTRNGGAYWQPFARQVKSARVLCPIG